MGMTLLFYLILAVITIVFHLSIAEYFADWIGSRPDAILLTSVFLGVRRNAETGLIGGFFLGLFEDVLSGGVLGFNALLNGLIGHYIGRVKHNMTIHVALFHCLVVFSASMFDLLFSAVLVKIFLPQQALPLTYWIEEIKTLGLNALLAPAAIALLMKIESKILLSAASSPYPERSIR